MDAAGGKGDQHGGGPVNRVVALSQAERRELWIRSAESLRTIPALMVEKDFWVC